MEQQLQAAGVTAILTSCGRFDLLAITLESFFEHNTYPLADFITYEDSCLPIPQELKLKYPQVKWIEAHEQAGQIAALDILWSRVNTQYAFTLEDDWKFLKTGFIEASLPILENNPKILQVWIKQLEDKNKHPIEWQTKDYGVFKTSPALWAWHRFNPSLKRKADYELIAPFSKHTTFDKYRAWKSEAAISQVYNKSGFTAAMLPDNYIKHIGEGRRVE